MLTGNAVSAVMKEAFSIKKAAGIINKNKSTLHDTMKKQYRIQGKLTHVGGQLEWFHYYSSAFGKWFKNGFWTNRYRDCFCSIIINLENILTQFEYFQVDSSYWYISYFRLVMLDSDLLPVMLWNLLELMWK